MFWAQHLVDEEDTTDTTLGLKPMPCFDNKRFLIRGEVSFHAALRRKMIMTYISRLRKDDPDSETNEMVTKVRQFTKARDLPRLRPRLTPPHNPSNRFGI